MKKTVAFHTLGCKVNQAESESMKRLFREHGYEVVDFTASADVVVINTCTVTHLADRKSRQAIRQARRRNPRAVVAVVGCYAQTADEKVAAISGVDVLVGTRKRQDIVALVEEAARERRLINAVGDIKGATDFEVLPLEFSSRTRAFLKIQEGCNQYCSYCIIPYARGPIRSLPPERVREAVETYVQKGYKEVVLTGIHLGLYGADLSGGINLARVLEMITTVPGLERLRLSSLEPMEVTDELLAVMAQSPKVCPHLHIPLQSGSDYILKQMNRPYTRAEFSQRVEKARKLIPDLGLSTDLIVGFPGESPEDFSATCEFVRSLGFSRLHVFPYSPRRGTPAAAFKGQVPHRIKEDRVHRLVQLGRELALAFHQRYLEKSLSVLVEHERDRDTNLLAGYTGNYIRVLLEGDDTLMGEIVPVTIMAAGEEGCKGIRT
jgi:threonylcarbamoyladenosine tRNA methylthiotransferase MtaB